MSRSTILILIWKFKLEQLNKPFRQKPLAKRPKRRGHGSDGTREIQKIGRQAVVGVVELSGGAGSRENGDQPHAKQFAHAPQPALWCENAKRQPVPIDSNAEWPLRERSVIYVISAMAGALLCFWGSIVYSRVTS
jgi:hypothetical protein